MKPTKFFDRYYPDLMQSVDDFFRNPWSSGWKSMDIPPINVKEGDQSFELEVALPGFDKKDVNVEVRHGVLTISSQNKKEEKEEKEGYKRMEYNYSAFSRSFRLPEHTLENNITAKYDKGQLIIHIPKSDAPESPKQYQVTIE